MKKKNSFIISLVLIPIMFVMIILASCGKTNLSNNSNEHNSTVKTEYTEEKYFEFSKMVEGYSVSLKEMPSSTTTIRIPNKYNNEPIIAIDENGFKDFTKITKIIIPNSVESIGDSAFSGCSSLESITIPFVGATATGNENKHFGYIFGASSYKENSKYVPTTLKEVIITSVTSIGERAFYSCYSLESITIPNSVTSIGERAFYDCDSLESIVIPNSVTSIGDSAFHGCSSLSVVTIDKESNLQSIEETAFFECSSLESIVIPTSVTSIGYRAFAYCSSLTIYCEASSRQSGWDNDWNRDWNERPVYWKGQWHYDEYGNPVPNE